MKRFVAFCLALVFLGSLASGMSADPQKRKRYHRKTVVVHRNFPIHRSLHHVYVLPIIRPYRVAPRIFLPLHTWGGIVSLTYPASSLYVWEDGETLNSDEQWDRIRAQLRQLRRQTLAPGRVGPRRFRLG